MHTNTFYSIEENSMVYQRGFRNISGKISKAHCRISCNIFLMRLFILFFLWKFLYNIKRYIYLPLKIEFNILKRILLKLRLF